MFTKVIETVKRTTTYVLRRLKVPQQDLHKATEVSEMNYYCRITYKLSHIQKNTKAYWTLLKKFFNNKKILLISPLLHGNDYVTDFKNKLNFLIPFLRNNVL